jgi:hypothetical protein
MSCPRTGHIALELEPQLFLVAGGHSYSTGEACSGEVYVASTQRWFPFPVPAMGQPVIAGALDGTSVLFDGEAFYLLRWGR